MAYTPVPAVIAGDWITEVFINTYWVDNMAAGVPDVFTTKGQLAVALGVDTMGVLNAGADDSVLTADAAQTLGVKWASSSRKKTRLRRSVDQTLPVSSTTAAAWDVEDQDDEGLHDNVTNNNRVTIVKAGTYRADGSILTNTNITLIELRKNGSTIALVRPSFASGNYDVPLWSEVDMIIGDYFDVAITVNASGGTLFAARSKLIVTRQ